MTIRSGRDWDLPEGRSTPEAIFLNRRAFMIGAAVVGGAALGGLMLNRGPAEFAGIPDPSRGLYPAARNVRYSAERSIAAERVATNYNNFYEFSAGKSVGRDAYALAVRPWTVSLTGLVQKPVTLGIDDILARVSLEERVYRHRCVEGWSMVVPWTGFPMKALLDLVEPLGSAKYVRLEAFNLPEIAGGQRQTWYPWPYVEALTIAEAAHELTFMVTGAYGKPLAKAMGAPLRLAAPWKYGFKSIKSIARISLVEQRPLTFWPQVDPVAHGFWGNVNPAIPNSRFSQASERDIGSGDMVPTRLFNGYGESVAGLYSTTRGEALYI